MSRVRVNCFAISLDGYGAGPRQRLDNPLGEGGMGLHQWFFPTRTFQTSVLGKDGGETGLDDEWARRGMENLGAWILGRNMFSPGRGAWDEAWKGWWGDNPPYHVPVFVLTHHPRQSIEMEGGTVFHFVTGGIDEALMRAKDAAGDRDVRIGGGAATIRQFVQARLVEEIHLVVSPVILGSGEHLLSGLNLPELGYRVVEHAMSKAAMHVRLVGAGVKHP
jgi:dihydrofolate reductase